MIIDDRIKGIGNGICNDTCVMSCSVYMTVLQMESSWACELAELPSLCCSLCVHCFVK